MSHDLITYLNYIAGLENATDEQLKNVITERENFIALGKSDKMGNYSHAVDSVFNKIDSLAKQLEEEEIAQESVKIGEDAAAVGAIFSFGMSMAAFAGLTASDVALSFTIKSKEKELHNHLENVDKDIANKIGGHCSHYVSLFKKNNDFIKANAPAGLSAQTARSYLYNYMDYISRNGGVNLNNFKKYIEVARRAMDDGNIHKIYAILDKFSLSKDHGQNKIETVLTEIGLSGVNISNIEMVRSFTYIIWISKMKISSNALSKAVANTGGIAAEEAEVSVFENMEALGKFAAAITIIVSVVDAFLNVFNIINTVKRYEKNVKLMGKAREQYKEYYKAIYEASIKYNSS